MRYIFLQQCRWPRRVSALRGRAVRGSLMTGPPSLERPREVRRRELETGARA